MASSSSGTGEVSGTIPLKELPERVTLHEEWIRMSQADRRAQYNNSFENYFNAWKTE
jgi:hypothetical protein